MGPTLTQSQPLFSPKRNPVYPIFDILVCQSKCQIPPVGYHLFENFERGKYINPKKYLKPIRRVLCIIYHLFIEWYFFGNIFDDLLSVLVIPAPRHFT